MNFWCIVFTMIQILGIEIAADTISQYDTDEEVKHIENKEHKKEK